MAETNSIHARERCFCYYYLLGTEVEMPQSRVRVEYHKPCVPSYTKPDTLGKAGIEDRMFSVPLQKLSHILLPCPRRPQSRPGI